MLSNILVTTSQQSKIYISKLRNNRPLLAEKTLSIQSKKRAQMVAETENLEMDGPRINLKGHLPKKLAGLKLISMMTILT